MSFDGYSKDTVLLARLAAAARKAEYEKAREEREAARLYAAETGDRYQRARDNAHYADWQDAGRGDDYDDLD